MNFKSGDKVRIINYGHIMFMRKDDEYKPDNILFENEYIYRIDMMPQIVGKEGIIKGSYFDLYGNGRKDEYCIEGIPGKTSWYNQAQLEPIKPQPVPPAVSA